EKKPSINFAQNDRDLLLLTIDNGFTNNDSMGLMTV
ncbi:MAG: Unknown protein, partial [uncultured Sulfurovum sp.]